MKNPLLTHFFRLMKSNFWKPIRVTAFLTLVITSGALCQTPASPAKSECTCLNNATTPTNGQYRDSIRFNATPGHVWELISPISGFYHPASLPPPNVPIIYLPGTIIPEVSPGVFAIAAKRVSGQGWSVGIRNKNTGEMNTVTPSQVCQYPLHPTAILFTGDANVCPGATGKVYTLSSGPTYSSLLWSLPSGGTITGGSTTSAATITWGPTPGRYSLGVSGIASSYSGQPLGCSFTLNRPIDVVDVADYTTIRGDFGNCIGATESYSIAATSAQLNPATISWGVFTDPAATITAVGISVTNPGGSINSRTIIWPNAIGVYYLAVRGQFRINSSADYCSFTSIQRIDIVNETTVPPMACKSLVNISMNPDCELYFQVSQFLEGQTLPESSFDIIIRDLATGAIIPYGALGYPYVGKTLEIKVVHECSGNSCWGYAKIEDKSIPDLVCPPNLTIDCDDIDSLNITGFPVMPVGADTTLIAKNSWRVTDFDRCSDVTISYVDTAVTSCTATFSSVITRTWRATDNYNNTSSCKQTLSVRRSTLRDVIFPPSWDSIAGPNPSLVACGNWKKEPYILNGIVQTDSVPSPDHTGWPIGIACLKSHVTYTDRKLLLCDGNTETYKLFRKWRVFDHCASKDTSYTQLIAVMDNQPPVVTCPADLKDQTGPDIAPAEVIFTKSYSCTADWAVLPPIVISDCSGYTWDVEFLLADNNGKAPVNGEYTKVKGATRVTGTRPEFTKMLDPAARPFTIIDLPRGRTWIRYTITDKCGNFTYCFTEVDVKDNQPPVAVCDRNSVVAISNAAVSGQAIGVAGVLTFDDGSHDNCGITCMKIRKVDSLTSWTSLPCDNKLTFRCSDVGKSIMVELGVWDADGAFNSCMVHARIQDNIFPTVNAPADMTINCKANVDNLSLYGTATASDNCTHTLRDSIVRDLNTCGVGTIRRFFIATDGFGNKTFKSQLLTVRNEQPVNTGDINWGPEIVNRTNNSCISRITPEDLNVPRPELSFSAKTNKCSNMAFSYEDVEFKFSDGVCRKILRTWTGIDWCQSGVSFSKSQLIMISNTVAPVIVNGCHQDSLKISPEGTCQARVEITARATETLSGDCVSNKLVWWYDLDVDDNGSIDFKDVEGNVFNRLLNYGRHRLIWYVKDDCNNVTSCTNIFTVRDTKKPTPVCVSDLVTVIMPTSREVSIWASDFLTPSTFDNCSPYAQIRASFSTNQSDISRTIRCSDLRGAAFRDTVFNVYAIDQEGNSDFCTVKLRVQSNNNSCLPAIIESVGFKGAIYSESAEMVQNVHVGLMSDQVEFPKSVMTSTDGKWTMAGLKMYKDYIVTADKNDDVLNGISTLDLVLIQRHILGLHELDSPYKLIAADVNNSQKVTSADLVELRKVILGIKSEFANNKSWRFIDVAHQFRDAKNPFPFVEKLSMTKVDHDVAGLDFYAVKIGDVNGTARKNANSPVATEPRTTVQLEANKVNVKKGEVGVVTLKASDLHSVTGLQMTLGLNHKYAELINITSDVLQLKSENLGLVHLSDGLIHLSWNDQNPVMVKDEMIRITFRALQDINDMNVVKLESAYLTPEMYISEGAGINTLKVTLQSVNTSKSAADQFELFQNVPNPFNAATVIGFNLPAAEVVTLKIFDLTGKLIYQTKGSFNKGYNTFSLDANELQLNGVLYYQVETELNSANRKMIIIK
jgi:hypothetical protein